MVAVTDYMNDVLACFKKQVGQYITVDIHGRMFVNVPFRCHPLYVLPNFLFDYEAFGKLPLEFVMDGAGCFEFKLSP